MSKGQYTSQDMNFLVNYVILHERIQRSIDEEFLKSIMRIIQSNYIRLCPYIAKEFIGILGNCWISKVEEDRELFIDVFRKLS